MNRIWQMWSGRLDNATVDKIIVDCEKYNIENASIGDGGNTQNDNYRTSEVRWVGSNSTISNMIWNYAREANRNAFGFDINYLKDVQFTTYNASDNGKYDWHHDTFWGNDFSYDRKLSVVIQLSDPEEYDGGLFEMDKQYEQPNAEDLSAKGTILVFPSFIPHRVTELTSGVRKSLVAWVEGPKFR